MSEEKKSKKELRQEAKREKAARKQKEERAAMIKKLIMGVVIVGVIIGVAWALKANRPAADEIIDLNPDPAIGAEDALVVVKEYSDFQCPACQAFYPVMKDILEDYGDQIRFEYNDFPLSRIHDYASTAAIGAECAFQQDRFFEYHDVLFDNQKTWAAAPTEDDAIATFITYATNLGLDMEAFNACTSGQDAADRVNEDYAEGLELGVNGTPTVFVNGERITETPLSGAIRKAIEAELADAGAVPQGGQSELSETADSEETEEEADNDLDNAEETDDANTE